MNSGRFPAEEGKRRGAQWQHSEKAQTIMHSKSKTPLYHWLHSIRHMHVRPFGISLLPEADSFGLFNAKVTKAEKEKSKSNSNSPSRSRGCDGQQTNSSLPSIDAAAVVVVKIMNKNAQ